MPIKPKQLEKEVLQAGFERIKSRGKGSHRRYRHPDGRTTEIPFHGREVRKGTESVIRRQAGLKQPRFGISE